MEKRAPIGNPLIPVIHSIILSILQIFIKAKPFEFSSVQATNMNASWIIWTALAFVHFTKSESTWFSKGSVRTITYNERGEQTVHEREMTEEEKKSLEKEIYQARDEIVGIGGEVVRF